MIDLYAHFASLEVLTARLRREVLSGSISSSSATGMLDAVQKRYPYAVLGAILDHLLAHAGPSDVEIARLDEAYSISGEVRTFIADLRGVRQTLEDVAVNPTAPDALARFNAARFALGGLCSRYQPLVARLQTFVWQLQPLRHLSPHPVAADQPPANWPWRDLILSRRTGALTAELMRIGRERRTPEALAFAFGVSACYAGNVVGSAYLTHAVGGPRRSHPYRDRVASHSVGAWIKKAVVPELLGFDAIRHVPIFGSPANPQLPAEVAGMLKKALAAVFNSPNAPAGLPDAESAYVQLVKHWKLLNSFAPIEPAAPIGDTLDVKIANTLSPQDWQWSDDPTTPRDGPEPEGDESPGALFDPGPGSPPWFMESHDNWWDYVKEACLDILFLPVFLVRVGFWLGHDASEKEPDQKGGLASTASRLSAPVTQTQFSDILAGKDILITVVGLHDIDAGLEHLASRCLKVLKIVGLIYPDSRDLPDYTFRQFVILPPASLGLQWPNRPSADVNLFLQLPAAGLEAPVAAPSSLAPGQKPIAFLAQGFGGSGSIQDEGFELLRDELLDLPSSPLRSSNLNLDADRGHSEECWMPAANTSIKDNPLTPVSLGYGDI